MLVLTRKHQEEIFVGDNVRITVIKISGNSVRIGIEAPQEVSIRRGELEVFAPVADEGAACDETEPSVERLPVTNRSISAPDGRPANVGLPTCRSNDRVQRSLSRNPRTSLSLLAARCREQCRREAS